MKTKLVWLVLLALWPTPAPADQCWGQGPPSVEGHPAAVRVTVDDGGSNSLGSGVLIADQDDRYGYVLTNNHVVRDRSSATSIIVSFPGGHQARARLIKTDSTWDLAALKIQEPPVEPVELAEADPRESDQLTAMGYGPEGVYRAVSGPLVGYTATSQSASRNTLVMRGGVRGGDSGGPILNEDGELSGVLWGTRGGETYGTCVGRIRRFLAGVFTCPPRRRPAPGPIEDEPLADDPPAPDDEGELVPVEPMPDDGLADRLGTIETQLAELLSRKPVPGPQGEPGEAGPPGPVGPQGPPATLDRERLQAMLDAYLATKPLIVEWTDQEGGVVRRTVPIGGTLKLPPIVFEKYNTAGQRVDKETVPLGGVFRWRWIEPPQE